MVDCDGDESGEPQENESRSESDIVSGTEKDGESVDNSGGGSVEQKGMNVRGGLATRRKADSTCEKRHDSDGSEMNGKDEVSLSGECFQPHWLDHTFSFLNWYVRRQRIKKEIVAKK